MPYYHVRISLKNEKHDEVKTDLDPDTLDRQILAPYRTGQRITINGKVISLADVTRILITASEETSASIAARLRVEDRNSSVTILGGPSYSWRAAAASKDVTDEFITGPPGIQDEPVRPPTTLTDEIDQPPGADRRTVFLVAGRDTPAIESVVALLRALGLHVIEWEHAVAKTGLPNPYVGDVVVQGLRMADAAIVILTPDDVVRLRTDLVRDNDGPDERDPVLQARPNVYYEAGIADALGRDRTVIVEVGKVKPFTDVSGRHVVRYDGSARKRNVLAERLRVAGLSVDTSGEDWLRVGPIDPSSESAATAIGRTTTAPSSSIMDKSSVISQIDYLSEMLKDMRKRSEHADLSDLVDESLDYVFQAQALLDRVSQDSSFAREAEVFRNSPVHTRIPILAAALRGLRLELAEGG